MKWDVDKALQLLESFVPTNCPGTIVQRVLMCVKLFPENGLKLPAPKAELDARGVSVLVAPKSVMVWSLAIGILMEPKEAFYGLTIRECFLKARIALKKTQPAKLKQSKKPKVKKSSKPRRKEQDT